MGKDVLIKQLRIYAMALRIQEVLLEQRQRREAVRMDSFKLTSRPIFEIPNMMMEYKDGKQKRRERRAEGRRVLKNK